MANVKSTQLPGGPGAVVRPEVNGAGRFAHIDALRAGAVLLVLLQHSGLTVSPGDSGVTAFFSISGFIITALLLKEKRTAGDFRVGRFYWRRFLKIFPPFAVAILLPTAIYSTLRPVDFGAVVSQIFFSYNWFEIYHPGNADAVLPGSSVVWSLAIEEQFYLFFAAFWWLTARFAWWERATVLLAVSAIAWATTARVIALTEQDLDRALRGTDVRMDAIAWGVLAAMYLERRSRPGSTPPRRSLAGPIVPFLATASFLAASIAGSDQWEQIWRGLVVPLSTCAVLLYGFVGKENRTRRIFGRIATLPPVSLIGLASYSIYIVHFQVALLVQSAAPHLPLPVRVTASVVVGLVAGLLLYRCVELPIAKLRRHQRW